MKNKILSLLLVLVMVVAVFVSCSPTPDNGDNGDTTTCAKHVDANGDGKCDNCGRSMGGGISGGGEEGGDTPSFTWDTTELVFRLTNNSNRQELSSGCEKYLAGESATDTKIDKMVRERNLKAGTYANVNIADRKSVV